MCQALRKEAAKVRRCHGNGMVKEEMSRERDAKRKRHQKKEAAGGRAGKAKGGQGKGGTKCRWQGKAVLRDREDLLGARRQGCQEREMSEEWDDKRQGLRSKDGDAKRKKCQGQGVPRDHAVNGCDQQTVKRRSPFLYRLPNSPLLETSVTRLGWYVCIYIYLY